MGKKPRRFGLAGIVVEILRRLRGLVFVIVERAKLLGPARRSKKVPEHRACHRSLSVLGSGVGSAVALLRALTESRLFERSLEGAEHSLSDPWVPFEDRTVFHEIRLQASGWVAVDADPPRQGRTRCLVGSASIRERSSAPLPSRLKSVNVPKTRE